MAKEEAQQSRYRPTIHQAVEPVGGVTGSRQTQAFQAAALSGAFNQDIPHHVQIQQALLTRDPNKLIEAFRDNPQVMKGNVALAEQLRNDPFYQEHLPEIAKALRDPAYATAERTNLARTLEKLTPDQAVHEQAAVPAQQRQQIAQRSLPAPDAFNRG